MKLNIEKLNNIKKNITQKLNSLFNKKNILLMVILLSVILLIPIIWTSFYTHPSADDYNYGVNTINQLHKSGVAGILKGSVKTLKTFYNEWQGTYSAIILFSLSPCIWGENFYFLTTLIIIGMLGASIYYFLNQVIRKFLNIDKTTCYMIFIIFFMLSLETMPSINQGLFWWNGASYYMIFFSLELIMLGNITKYYIVEKKSKVNYIVTLLLTAIVAGGNFITALQQIILLFFLNFYLIIKKKNKSALPLLIVSIVGLIISAIAPGNANRAASVIGMSPVKSIIMSFIYAFCYSFRWITPLNFLILTFIEILLIPTYKEKKLTYKFPIIVILLLYCLFSAEFTPTLYATSNIGEGRLHNIMYISYLLIFLAGYYYLIGYIRNKIISQNIFSKIIIKDIKAKLIKSHGIVFSCFLLLIIGNFVINKEMFTSYQTYRVIKDGSAKIYDKECDERQKILKNPAIKKVEFEKLTVTPYPIFYCDFSEDSTHWLNIPATEIYDKDYIKVK